MYLVTDLKEMTYTTMYVTLQTLTLSKVTVLLERLEKHGNQLIHLPQEVSGLLLTQMQRLLSWTRMIKLVVEHLHT